MATSEDGHCWTWEAPGALAVFTTRAGGVSPAPWSSCNVGLHVGDDPARVLENRRRVAALVGLEPSRVAGVTQVHGTDVWIDLGSGGELPREVRWDAGASDVRADALVSTRTGAGLAVGVADCVPIAVAWGDAIAAIHAGWRSLAGGIIEATFAVLRRATGPAVALADAGPRAVLGPCIGACCLEVGEEVAARFPAASVIRRPGAPRPFLDARSDARRRLEAAGCGSVEEVAVCTADDHRCFSHRRDGAPTTGRQALVVRRVPEGHAGSSRTAGMSMVRR